MKSTPVYLDHAATTPLRDEVRAAMAPYFSEAFGNPSSVHRWGREASAALEDARALAAQALGARPGQVRFVRGGTESDNLAVQGTAARMRTGGELPTLVVTAVEHKAVLDAARATTARGNGRLVVLTVSPDGHLDMDRLSSALKSGPSLVSCMWVNNETGMILPLPEVLERAREAGAVVHSDAVQAVGKIEVRLDRLPIDLLTVTGHKIYGPKGTGLLFLRDEALLAPLVFGGGQERGLRPGTEDVAGAVGLAEALRLAVEEREAEAARLGTLRDRLEADLIGRIDGLRVNAGAAPRAPHVANVAVPGIDGQALLIGLDLEGVAASGGSACDSGAAAASHVITALYGPDDPHATLRFSLGRLTTPSHVDRAVAATCSVVDRLTGSASR